MMMRTPLDRRGHAAGAADLFLDGPAASAGARGKSGIAAPAMTGDPLLERAIRVHYNTLEWLPIFLVSLWLFAIYWNDLVAAGLGVVWIVGRILYAARLHGRPGQARARAS